MHRRKSMGDPREKSRWWNRMRSLIEKMQGLDCPYLDGMEEQVVSEVIFNPGEARTRILTWLTARINPSLVNVVSSDGATISTIPRLATLLGDAGLCLNNDHELIKGTTSLSKQLFFMESLVEMASWPQDRNYSSADMMQSVAWQQMRSCCHFIDDLCQHNELCDVFPSSVSLIPPGITLMADKMGVASPDLQGMPAPLPFELTSRCDQVRALLEEKQLELEGIRRAHVYSELQPDALESCHKMVAVSLGTLVQVIASFCYTYKAEIQPWTNHHIPTLSGIGPLFRKIDHQQEYLAKFLLALGSLERSFQQLDELKTSLTNSHENSRADHLCAGACEALKGCLAALKDDH